MSRVTVGDAADEKCVTNLRMAGKRLAGTGLPPKPSSGKVAPPMMPKLFLAALLIFSAAHLRAAWTAVDGANDKLSGRKVDIKDGERLVAQFIYGEGQIKPYLHVFGEEGDWLTEWSPKQSFPHHRGIYIGWNRISSDLGTFDLWHFNNGGK